MQFDENRCKHCAKRQVFYCPVKKREVEPGNEVFSCDAFEGKERGQPPEQKKQGSLGGG